MSKIGVLLSGCGVFDGAEIHEAVITLLALDRAGADRPGDRIEWLDGGTNPRPPRSGHLPTLRIPIRHWTGPVNRPSANRLPAVRVP